MTTIERPLDEALDRCPELFTYATILRHPLSMMRSTTLNNEFSIAEVIDHLDRGDPGPLYHTGCLPAASSYQHFDNFVTRCLLGYDVYWLPPGRITRAHLASAREVLASLDLVLILEDLADEGGRIESALGWNASVMEEDRANSHDGDFDFTPAQRASLRRQNWADLELYEFARGRSAAQRARASSTLAAPHTAAP